MIKVGVKDNKYLEINGVLDINNMYNTSSILILFLSSSLTF
jgi:hypothetical protein